MTRVAVFIDYQNTYMGAREAFDVRSSFVDGQVYPLRLGIAATQLGREKSPDRALTVVKVYRGEPSPKHNPKAQAACQRQLRFWAAQNCVEPVTRPLSYMPVRDARGEVTDYVVREKGIDVLIALDMVTGAQRDEYDVAVLMSADTDLVPALERVGDLGKRVEVAAWDGGRSRRSLRVPGKSIWCHRFDLAWYNRLHDPTDYTIPSDSAPSANP